MAKEDRGRADARFTRPGAPKVSKSDYDIAAKAVLDNMAKLKALRLAREAAEPPPPAAAKKTRAKSRKKSEEKAPALSDWLVGQQSGGRRT
jgi:hypothetical protein